jgi:thiol-disulfide isomerase/thioredoxin
MGQGKTEKTFRVVKQMEILSTVKEFTKSKFNLGLLILLLLIGTALLAQPETQAQETRGMTVNYFYLPTCPHCAEQKPIILELQQEMPEVSFVFHDASSAEGSALFYQMASEAGMDTSRLGTPTTFIGKRPLVGVHSKQEILNAITECIEQCQNSGQQSHETQELSSSFTEFELPFLGRTDLTTISLPVLAIVLGLIDGFNPCAMWVLVYLIALLIDLNDRKKIWFVVGSFILASGILYFLFMAAWLNVFLVIGYLRPITILIGLVALGGGILGLKEYLATKGALECKVGDEGSHKKTINRIQELISKPMSIAVLLGIFALAFVVNSVEFVCSSAIPAVFTQILALSNLSTIEHYAYILLYDFFFMLDDLIIFGLAAFAVSSSFGEKYAKYCKALGGIILIILGLVLLFAPHLLR